MMRSSKSHPVIANDLHSPRLMVGVENTAPSLNNLRRESRQVLGIQMSRWGRDVLHPEGNLLIRFGLQRFRQPGQFGSSRYRCHWAGRTVELHSTCVGIYGDESPGIVFLRAHRCAYLMPGPEPWIPMAGTSREGLRTPRTPDERWAFFRALSQLLEWVERYEHWATPRRPAPAQCPQLQRRPTPIGPSA